MQVFYFELKIERGVRVVQYVSMVMLVSRRVVSQVYLSLCNLLVAVTKASIAPCAMHTVTP